MLTLSFHRFQLTRTRRVSMVRAVHSTSITPITLYLYWRSIYQHRRFLSPRYLSTPSSTPSKPSKDEPGTHAIPPVPHHKTKVELRPGPIKPLTAPPGSHSEKMKQVATKSAPSLQPTSPTAGRTEAVAQTPKRDFKRTYIHGVLARPPPDAGKIAKLWHQVKELFVSRAS